MARSDSPRSFTSARPPHSLPRRLLFPALTTPDLPPLLADPATPPELTAELYDFIALALRAYISPWWSPLARYDKDFLPEITRILTAVLRVLEIRLRAVDLAPLVFRDIPAILTQHYRDYRNAASKAGTAYAAGGAASVPQLFHQLQPHMAIDHNGAIDREYVRQIVDHILKTCLPADDYDPEVERYIVREIILKVLLDDIVPKITQPWFIYASILNVMGSEEDILLTDPPDPTPSSFSFHSLLVVILSAIQTISGACLALIYAYKQARSTIKLVNATPQPPPPPAPTPPPDSPRRKRSVHVPDPLSISSSLSTSSSSSIPSTIPAPPLVAIPPATGAYSRAPLAFFAEVLSTSDRFAASTLTAVTSMVAASCAPLLDRLLPYLLTSALAPPRRARAVRRVKDILFPGGHPAQPPPDPTPAEQARMRARIVEWRPRGAAARIAPLVLGSDPAVTIGAALDPLSSASCNAHLVLLLLDCIVATLFPELVAGAP